VDPENQDTTLVGQLLWIGAAAVILTVVLSLWGLL